MEAIGDILREARHAKGLSLEDVARATRIKLDVLERLEADEFERLAGVAYTKGFLRLYADYLGLDSQGLVDAFVRSQGGVRREGLTLETQAAARARRPGELKLPLRSVVLAVLGLTAAVVIGVVGRAVIVSRAEKRPRPDAPATLPAAGFDAFYQPKTRPAPETLELPAPQ
jgi:cytoskeletal protein RodZ